MRSRGAVLLARLTQTQAQIAREVSVSVAIVNYWQNGERKPGIGNRKALLARYKIPIEAWDEEPTKPPTSSAASAPSPTRPSSGWGESSAVARISLLESMAQELIDRLSNDASMTPLEGAKVLAQLTHAEKQLRSMKGENAPEVRLVTHPKWLAVKRAILEALKDHPKALRAVVDALSTLEEVA